MFNFRLHQDFSKLDRLERDLPRRVRSASYEAAKAGKQYMIDNWSPESPSAPGNPPAKVTGELERSIVIEQARGNGGRFSSGFSLSVTAEYAAALEYGSAATNLLPRPYFHPAMFQLSRTLGDHFKELFDNI